MSILQATAERTRLWRWSDVTAWFRDHLSEEPAGDGPQDGRAVEQVNAVVNARLGWLRYQDGLDRTDRRQLEELLLSDPTS